jgi:hypothetical protein
MRDEANYICDNCGEEIVVPVDPSAGSSQEYVEDCPVAYCHIDGIEKHFRLERILEIG